MTPMTKIDTVFLDMDGVVCDFVGAACKLFNQSPSSVTRWDFFKDWGYGEYAFWNRIDAEGEDFWSGLKEVSGVYSLVRTRHPGAKIIFCTNPSHSPTCASGKLKWLQARFGREFKDYVFTSHKHLLAKPNTLLIDDNDDNVKRFFEAGGNALLWPQPWNKAISKLKCGEHITLQQLGCIL